MLLHACQLLQAEHVHYIYNAATNLTAVVDAIIIIRNASNQPS